MEAAEKKDGGRAYFLSRNESRALRRLVYNYRLAVAEKILAMQRLEDLTDVEEDDLFDLIRIYAICDNLYCTLTDRKVNTHALLKKYNIDLRLNDLIENNTF